MIWPISYGTYNIGYLMTDMHETDMTFGDTCRTGWFWVDSQVCHFQVQSSARNILTLVCSTGIIH